MNGVGRVALSALAYFLLGRAAIGLALPPGYASIVWPAAGFALAAILLDGRRLWPGVWLGSFLVNNSIAADRTGSWFADDFTLPSLIATGAVAQAIIGASLLRHFVKIPLLVKPREIWLALTLGGPIHCLVNASWSVFWMCALGVSEWDNLPKNWLAWWIGDSLGATVTILLLLALFGKPRSLWRPRLASVAIPMLMVLAATTAVFKVGQDWERAGAERRLQAHAQSAAQDTRGWFSNANVGLVSWRNFLTDDPAGDLKQRDRFVLDTLDYHHSLHALAILTVVPDRERAVFEAEQRTRIPKFQIVETGGDLEFVPAASRDRYICLTYISALGGLPGTPGLDFANDTNCRDALVHACDTDAPVAVPFRSAMPAHAPLNAVWVFLPLYGQVQIPVTIEERRKALRGYAAAIYDMDWIVSRATEELRSQDLHAIWQPEALKAIQKIESVPVLAHHGNSQIEVSVVLSGLSGTLHLKTGPAYRMSGNSTSLWLVLVLGFSLAIMIAVTQLTSSGQTFLVEAEVQKRTSELTQEIQERERIQAALTRSEVDIRKLALIADRTDNLVVLTDDQGRIEWVNAGFTRVTEFTLDEVKGQSPGMLLQGLETDQRTVTHMRECLRRGDGFVVEILNYSKSGRKYWLFIEVQPLRDEDGRLIRFMAIQSDITERKMAEHDLRASEGKLAAVISTAMDGFWESDREGRILSVNDAYCRTSGYSREELLRLRITNLEAAETPEETMRHIKKIFAEGSDRFETRHRRKDGSVYDVEISVRFVPEWDHSFVFVQDISARKQAHHQLQLAKESAEAANSAKSAFLANVSHEIRTPMNGILVMAELLSREVTTAQQRDRLEVIQNSAIALLSVINDLLDLSRIEAGKLTLEMRPFELHKELTQIIKIVADSANRRGLKVELVIATAVARHVVGDAGRLRQVLLNLIGNAIKFTERGGAEIRVYTPTHRDPHLIAFAVTDTGVGIPPDKLTDIFQPFEQVDSSATRRFGGTGLGLSISSRLVEAMGGTIDVESTPGKGSTFTFTARLEPCAASEVKSYPTDGRNWSAGMRPLHVLLAEDNAVNQLVTKDMLHQAGHRVRVVSNGREVLAALDEERFDVVLMDVQMPEMDGLEATEAIRRREAAEGGHLPIVALTAMAVRDDEDRCRRAGMDGFITKPIDWAELGQAFRDHCGTAGLPAVTVDRETILARMGGKLPLVKQVLDVFEKNYPRQIAEMRAAIDARQTQQLSRAAHKLVGGLGNFDQGEGLKRARDLEATDPTTDLAAASVDVEKLEADLNRLVTALRAWLAD